MTFYMVREKRCLTRKVKVDLFCKEDSLLLDLLSVGKALWFVQRLERLFLEPWDRENPFVFSNKEDI